MSSSTSSRKITLKSSDGEDFEVDVAVASKSQMIKLVIEDGCEDNAIPLPNVTSKVLTKVIEYCKKHTEEEDGEDKLRDWDAQYVKVDKVDTLFDLILAANYLDIKSLLDLLFQAAADRIKDDSVEKIRKIFGIENDFTPEEENQLREEHKWAHDP